MEFNHTPIMLDECISNLNILPNGIYVDATIGGAGHSREIAKKLNEHGTLVGFDKDLAAIEVSKERLKDAKCKLIFIHSDFGKIKEKLSLLGIEKVDGILADLGVSSHQIDEPLRGFSYSKDGPLDMRMDTTQSLTAKKIVNTYPEKDLVRILFDYGEENFARKIAKNIVLFRKEKPIETTKELVSIIEKSYPAKILHKGGSVAKKTFQALRIETNGELDTLKSSIEDMIDLLSPHGRLAIITFHSLEDRIVKNAFVSHSTGCICPKNFPICVCNHKADAKVVTKKPLTPSNDEQLLNSRSSSSKLRVLEKL